MFITKNHGDHGELFWLVVDFYPSDKYIRQFGDLIPIYGKIKVMFQSPPTSFCLVFSDHQGDQESWSQKSISRLVFQHNYEKSPCSKFEKSTISSHGP